MQRKAPIRTCVACGAKSDKRTLVRIVRSPEGAVLLDERGKAAGRGAYVCCSEECFAVAKKKRLLESKLRTKIDAEVYAELEKDFRAVCAQHTDKSNRDGE